MATTLLGGQQRICAFTLPECTHPQGPSNMSFINIMRRSIALKLQSGKAGTAKNYRATLNSFISFLQHRDISSFSRLRISKITPALIADYQIWLYNRGICSNSISFYIRNLRSVYNAAAEVGAITRGNPFSRAYTRIEKTGKRAVGIDDIRRIKMLDLGRHPELDRARDIFMFLFYCRGMSFIDAAFLNAGNICGNEIRYRRHKTGQEIRIGLNSHITEILSKWGIGFIIPAVNAAADRRRVYESALRRTNRHLKQIAALAGLTAALTTYVSRHSWASIAKSKGIPTATISDALGHNSERTTQIYLATISDDIIDRANDTVLSGL